MTPDAAPRLVVLAVLVSALVLGRLLYAGHDVGTRLRRVRSDHRQLVDIVAQHDERMRILQHPTPTAYCIPGRQSRVVLSQGVLDALPADQLDAVIAHEEAHLRGRHDLLLEFFAVVTRAVPGPLRSPGRSAEVRLLVEALADRAAVRRSGEVATARALVTLAGSRSARGRPRCGHHGTGAPAAARRRAAEPRAAGLAYSFAAVAATLPLVLLGLAWA